MHLFGWLFVARILAGIRTVEKWANMVIVAWEEFFLMQWNLTVLPNDYFQPTSGIVHGFFGFHGAGAAEENRKAPSYEHPTKEMTWLSRATHIH